MADSEDSSTKQLCCPICLEPFDTPKSLPCMHTFCEKCIRKHASNLRMEGAQSVIISCPVCRYPIPPPRAEQGWDDWTSKLPDNPLVLSLDASNVTSIDVLVYCEPCATLGEQYISVAFCVTCSEYLCQTCYNCHKRFKVSRDHQITVHSVREYQSSNLTHETIYMCQAHNEKFTYFCSEHRELCCMKCALRNHRKCKHLLCAEDRVNDVTERQDFQEALENLDILRNMFVLLIDNRETSLETIGQQKLDVIKTIKDWSRLIKDKVDQFETATIQELEQICKERTIIISDQAVECNSVVAAIETSQRMLIESRKSEDPIKVFVTLSKVSQQLWKYLQKYDRIENRSNEIKVRFIRDKNLENIQNLGTLGQVSSETFRIPKLSPSSLFKGTCMMPSIVKLKSPVTFNAHVNDDKQQCNITSGVSLPDKRTVLYDQTNRKIKLFDKRFHFVSHLELYSLTGSMCIVNERTVAISYYWRIQLVSVTDSLELLRNIEVTTRCYGLASYQQNLMACVNGDSIFIYDASYKVSKRIPSFDSAVEKDISVSPDGQKIHYIKQNKIVTMDMNGKKLETFQSNELKGVIAITVDKNGIIYCCGQMSNNVVLFSQEGRQLCVLLSSEHGLRNPIGICLNDRNNKLFVFESNLSNIKVFSLAF
ncbi:hypothetical protein ACJMK2_017266 [Sinanodonta woodiana]|uniref:RING-type domain-containing protein n=1 Tax=Sinanodonta woodiana TaxID=1069815 RepID=A0ABD3UX30_SINWO